MEHSTDTFTTPDTQPYAYETTFVEEKVENLYAVIESDQNYLVGPAQIRAEFKEVVAEVHAEIDDVFSSSKLNADKLHKDLDDKIAVYFDKAVQRVVENGEVTNEFLDVIKEAPVGLDSLKPHIDKWHDAAIKAQKDIDLKPKTEQSSAKREADVLAVVAAEYGAGIPAIKKGQQVIPSGEQYKLDWLRAARKDARGRDPESKAKFEAINKVCVAAYGTELKDPNALIEKVGTVARRAVASVAVAGVLSALPQFAAHADTGPKTTEVVPDGTAKSDKSVTPDKKVTIEAPKPTSDTKQAIEVPRQENQPVKELASPQEKTDKKVEPKQPENAIIIPDNLVETPISAEKKSDEKSTNSTKQKDNSPVNNSDKTTLDKIAEKPKNDPATQEAKSKNDAKPDDHAILIDPSHLIDSNEKSDDKSHEKDKVTAQPIIEQSPADKTKDKVDETVVSIIDGVVKIDEDKLDKKSEKESDKSNNHETDEDKAPKVIDGVITLTPENLGEDKTATEEVLISPTLEIPKPQIIEIPTYKQEAPRQEQGPSTPQGDYSHASDKLAGRGGVWERRGIAMKFFIDDPELAMTPSQAARAMTSSMPAPATMLSSTRLEMGPTR